jgi:hypothetical protein
MANSARVTVHETDFALATHVDIFHTNPGEDWDADTAAYTACLIDEMRAHYVKGEFTDAVCAIVEREMAGHYLLQRQFLLRAVRPILSSSSRDEYETAITQADSQYVYVAP